jgi:hypothetical protein
MHPAGFEPAIPAIEQPPTQALDRCHWDSLRSNSTNNAGQTCGRKHKVNGENLFEFSSSSSYCWASVANAPNVLQPYWLIVLPLDVPALTTSLPYEILAARGGIIYRTKDVPTLYTSSARPRPLSRESWSYIYLL